MQEIQVGEYVRTKDGVIAKVTATGYGIDCDRDVFDLKSLQMMEIPPEHIQEYIIKHSFNIIDLIEVGDYVNGREVIKIYDFKQEVTIIETSTCSRYTLYEGVIKSIVTKEQFKAMEYEVE